MNSFTLEYDDQVYKGQGDCSHTLSGKEVHFTYREEDGEEVNVFIEQDQAGYLIRETSATRNLYLSLSSNEEEGYLKTPYGMLIFTTCLIEEQFDEEILDLTFRLNDGQEENIRHFKLFFGNKK